MTGAVGLSARRRRLGHPAGRVGARARAESRLCATDAGIVVLSYVTGLLGRYDGRVPSDVVSGFVWFLLLAVAAHLTLNVVSGLYGIVWAQASVQDARRVLRAGAAATLLLVVSQLPLSPRLVPLSVALFGGFVATSLFGLVRFGARLRGPRRRVAEDAVRVLIVGAGESATSLLRELARDESNALRPVALLDDDPRKLGRRLGGIPIVGTTSELAAVGRRLEVDVVLLAIPSASAALVQHVADAVAGVGVPLKVLPGVAEFVNGHPQLRDVRDLSIGDLLGRQQIHTDLAGVEEMVRGRCVLVTGGGGSIGSEISRQLVRYAPSRLLLLDRDETHLFDAAADVEGPCEQILLDIRDAAALDSLFARERPQIVFHAAANKHVPLLEAYPCEAVGTNVLGTYNVIRAAREHGVEHAVFISTDKAVNPTSVMGASKRVAEQLVLSLAPAGARWCAVRFGNVLGSRGSVVPTFMRQITQGGPVTLTHPEMTRYFMTIPEAVHLVLQSAALARDREVFMLDMGDPVRILDLANRMITLAGYRPNVDVAIEITGLRPGEKLSEELSTPDERAGPTAHPKVLRLRPPLLEASQIEHDLYRLGKTLRARDDQAARDLLFEIASRSIPVICLPEARVPEYPR